MTSGNNIPVYNVSEITYLIKSRLEEDFPVVKIQGEISTFRKAASGHCYFVLKDRESILNAVIFRFQAGTLDFVPEDGQSVIVLGRVTVYPQRGNYQIICETMEKVGKGDILLMLEERKKRLAREGLFDSARKRPLPLFPEKIGIITSEGGAALQDVIRVLKRRMHGFTLYIYDSLVQGEKAPECIVKGIEFFNTSEVDLILLTRGGGSVEDLLAFSDEKVVRAVADSQKPLITGVGHEIDFTLVDFASDLRAATPSAAAEIISQAAVNMREKISDLKDSLSRSLDHKLEVRRLELKERGRENLIRLYGTGLDDYKLKLDLINSQMIQSIDNAISHWKHKLALNRADIENQSPWQILKKGFSLVVKDDRIISSRSELDEGDLVEITMQDGSRTAKIEGE